MDPIDALDRARRQMLWAVIVTSTLWLLPQVVLATDWGGLAVAWRAGLGLAAAAGALAWMFFMWRYHRFQRNIRGDEALSRRVDDERVREVRRESIQRAWYVLVVALGLGVAASAWADLPAQPILLALLLLGVNLPLLFFLHLDRG